MRQGIVATLSRKAALVFAASIVTLLAFVTAASAATFAVNDTTDAGLQTSTDTNCVSSHGGSCTLQAAVQAANNVGGASTITVPAGTFNLVSGAMDINTKANNTVLTVTGAGSGSTVIDGGQNDSIFAVEVNGGLTVSAMTLQNGANFSGGAIYSNGALVVGNDTVFKGSDAFEGGAIYSDNDIGSTLSVTGARFDANSVEAYGGAIYDDSPNPATITGSTFFENSTFGGNGCTVDLGGAIFADNGPLSLDHSSFSTNLSSVGGAIFYTGVRFVAKRSVPVAGSALSITNSTFTNNSAQTEPFLGCSRKAQPVLIDALASGGAIYDNGSSSLNLTGDQLVGNTATLFGGGAFLASPGTSTVNADEFDGNSSKYEGGAFYTANGPVTSTGSSFIDNTAASSGGGLYLDSGSLFTLINATLSGNSAALNGGGAMEVGTSTPATLTNDTVAHNTGGAGIGLIENFELTDGTNTGTGMSNTVVANNVGGDCFDTMAASFDAGHNLDSDSSCVGGLGVAGDQTVADAKLGQPADNGGPVLTDAELAGSPAIDSGTNTGCPATDARGITRPQGASCDIGAYELAPAALQLFKTAPASAVQGAAFVYTLTVSNHGPGTSTTTNLTDQLPAGETLYGVTPDQGTCSSTGSPAQVTCSLGNIVSGASAVVSIVASESKTGPVTNTASATNDQSSNVTDSATTNITASSPSSGGRPEAITGNTTGITSTKATIHGQVIPNGTSTQYFFQYGTGKSYGHVTSPHQVSSTTNVSANLANLANATTYHYRLVALNGNGTSYGNDKTFKTKGHRFLGRFLLINRVLHVRNGRVYATFKCDSSVACLSRFSIVIHAHLAHTSTVAVLDFTTTRQSPRLFGALQTLTVSAPVTAGALAYLEATLHGQIGGKISARPRTNQIGLIELITLVLG